MDIQETAAPPPDILLTGYFKEDYGYAVYRSKGSGNWLITYTLQGQGTYRQKDICISANPGDVILLQPGTVHDYAVPEGGCWEFFWAHFQPRAHWHEWWHIPETVPGLHKTHISAEPIREQIQQAFDKLHRYARGSSSTIIQHLPTVHAQDSDSRRSSEPINVLQRELALNNLESILLLVSHENIQSHQSTIDTRIHYILDLITQDLRKPHTLESLARSIALSPSRLSHLFKQEIGESVTNTIITLRLNKAALLLEFSSMNIAMIAEEVGIGSAFYFSRLFQQRFGMSPRAYRAAIIGKPPTSS